MPQRDSQSVINRVIEEESPLLYRGDNSSTYDIPQEMLEEVGDLDFELTGTTDCNGNEFQDFRILKESDSLKVFSSDWYNKACLEDLEEDEIEDLELSDPLF